MNIEAVLLVLIIATILIIRANRKSLARFAKRQARKTAKKARIAAKAAIIWTAKSTWAGVKAAGREYRAHATFGRVLCSAGAPRLTTASTSGRPA